jgi:hypothetical protein
MRVALLASAAAMAVCLSGCASITRGHTDQVQIESDPPGAEARTSMGHVCTTPCTLQFDRKDEFVVTFTKPGYHTEEIPVTTQVAGAGAAGFAGNILLGGAVGMVVDASSGATLEHFPNPVIANLERVRPGERARTIKRQPPPPAPKSDEVAPRT